LNQLLLDTDLAMVPTRPYPLRPLRRDALPAVIQGPARLAGITVAENLVARVVAAKPEQQRDVAVPRQLAGQAFELRATNPALAAQLGLAAYRLVPTAEARRSLLSTVANPYATTARLWIVSDPHQPTVLGTLTGHTNFVYSVAFSPDEHTLTTSSVDDTARLWETNVDRVAARICSLTPPSPPATGINTCPAWRTALRAHELRGTPGPQDPQMLRRTAENAGRPVGSLRHSAW
jgi:WD domain, G-beta repeat